MKKIRFLIASGPTRERIDPVRFISNDSTGTMGRHLVEEAKKKGHAVDWVNCPNDAESALDLLKVLRRRISKCDVLFMVAAVCDARPVNVAKTKIKKASLKTIRLVKNPDILADISKKKRSGQFFVGFGLESERLLDSGFEKLKKKGLDLIVVQKVNAKDKPFGEKKIDAYLVDGQKKALKLARITKQKLAKVLVSASEDLFAGGGDFC